MSTNNNNNNNNAPSTPAESESGVPSASTTPTIEVTPATPSASTNTNTNSTLGVVQPTTPEALSEAWKAYNINRRKELLDKQATELADRRENSSASRKRLIKETSDYRKLPASDPGKVGKASALLKLYQEEIDSITKRCKAAETAFSDAYRNIIEVPDVSLAVSAMLDERTRGHRAAEVELENKRLKDELEAFRKEFSELKNQQVTIRRLEAQAKEAQREAAEAQQVAAEQRAAAEEERMRSVRLEETLAEKDAFVKQLQGEAARALKASQDSQATLLSMRSSFETQLNALRSEIELLSGELEKKKNNANIESASSGGSSNNSNAVKSETSESSPANELKVAQQEIEISRLEHTLAELRESVASEREAFEQRITQLEGQLATSRSEKEVLERSKPSPEEYARVLRDYETLRVLVEGDAAAATTVSASADAGAQAAAGEDAAQGVEQMLYTKSRKLEAENARLRTRVDELETLSAQQKEAFALLGEENSKMRTLVERLEDQLSQHTLVETADPSANTPATAASTAATGLQASSDSSSAASGSGEAGSVVEPPQAGSATAVLEIVCSQRDRFRDRIAELEAEKSQLMDSLERAENSANTLRGDNVKLYERVKFLQSYSNGSSSGSASGSGGSGGSGNRRSIKSGGGDDDIDVRYGKMYEDAANPFMEFSKRERMRKIREMNATDRFLYKSAKVLLSNKYIRLGFFIYMILLHLVVFLSLYKLAWSATDTPPFVEGQTL